jgi:hypothetical protein
MHEPKIGEMQGSKTHTEFQRTLERKAGVAAPPGRGDSAPDGAGPTREIVERTTEYATGERKAPHESEHNKHNLPPKGAPKH